MSEVEQRREFNEGVHPLGPDDSVPILQDPAWTVFYRGRNSTGHFTVYAGNPAMAERAAEPLLSDGERIVRVHLGGAR